ncbi:cytochrome b5 isoform X2 [Rhodnius prolixus]|uniref:cytochrome b5 isoform X2 n=1 Tax=Rhodnius prolixus TaxID=13249 RepID=UPI003D18EEA2
MKTYSWQEIAKHNGSNGSYWLVIHGSVHDLTNFLEEHPGGEEILMNLAGKDASECFDDIGHSYDAKTLCKKFKIGVVFNHPGGEEVLLEQAGRDATEAFEDVGHSTDAREMMSKYKIGELAEEDRTSVGTRGGIWEDGTSGSPSANSSWKAWLLPVVIGIVSTMFYRYFLVKQ